MGAGAAVGAGVTAGVAPNGSADPAVMGAGVAESMGAAAYDSYWKAAPTPENHAAALYALYHDMLNREGGGQA